jgi:Peptidase family M28
LSPRGRSGPPSGGGDADRPRRRPRPGTLERPVSGRLYRTAWAAVAVPLLVAAFSVGQPDRLPPPRLEPSFDQRSATFFTRELARRFPDRSPGSRGGAEAAEWVAARFRDVGLDAQRDEFEVELAGLGRVRLVNLVAVAPGRSPETIVVTAHRDNSGRSPGANDNASGTGALLELARNVEVTRPAHTLVFLSTDGGAFGGAGAARFAERPELLQRLVGGSASVIAVVNVDAIAGGRPPRVLFGGDAARSPSATLVATADESIAAETERPPERPAAFAQVLDLGFPYTLHEQGPFVAHGTPAVTITTGGERPEAAAGDSLETLDADQLGALGRSAQDLLLRLDATAELARGTQSYVYAGSRVVRGWTIQFALLAALLPFLVATVDLFARCRRRHVALAPALRSLASRLGVWVWIAVLFLIFVAAGALPSGAERPISPDATVAGDWPVAVVVALGALGSVGWLVARQRLIPRTPPAREDELGGHLAAMIVLGLVALVVAGTNPYSLVYVLPSLHAWLWLPHISRENVPLRLAVWAAGFVGPLLLVGSFAVRFGLGWDAPWYLVALVSVGYVAPPLLAATLVWAAVAGQVGALAVGRYAPYPAPGERPARGPIREGIRRVVLRTRRRRAAVAADADRADTDSAEA